MRDIVSKAEINRRIDKYEESLINNSNVADTIVAINKTKEWSTWSLTKHTPDEIREKCLTDFNNVCFTYVCETSPIPEDFLLEFAALSTGLLNKDNYKSCIKKLINIMKHNYGLRVATDEELEWYCKLYYKNSQSHKGLDEISIKKSREDIEDIIFDRIDWIGLSMINNFSEKFMNTYADFIDWKYLSVHRKYSKKFFEKYKNKIPILADNNEDAD